MRWRMFGNVRRNTTERASSDQVDAKTGSAFALVPVEKCGKQGILRLYRGLYAKRLVVLSCYHLREEGQYRPFRLRGVDGRFPTHEFRLQSAIPDFVGPKVVAKDDIRVHFRAQIDVSEGRIGNQERMIAKFREQSISTYLQQRYLSDLVKCSDLCAASATDFIYNQITKNGALVIADMGVQNFGNTPLEDLGRQIRQKGFLDLGSNNLAIDFGTSNADAIFWATVIALWMKQWEWPDH